MNILLVNVHILARLIQILIIPQIVLFFCFFKENKDKKMLSVKEIKLVFG